MIRIKGKSGVDLVNKIYFEPRAGFTRGKHQVPSFEYPLLYGHKCMRCSNVIQALFKAPSMFDLWPYEETVLLSQGEKNAGELRKIFPDEKTRFGKSCYKMVFSPAEGGSVKITLRNHIMTHKAIVERKFNGEGLWETGERPCTHAGVFALREDLLVKDFLLFSNIEDYELPKYNIPPIISLIPEDDKTFLTIPAVGTAPPVILVERQSMVYGFHYATRQRMAPFRKTT